VSKTVLYIISKLLVHSTGQTGSTQCSTNEIKTSLHNTVNRL